MVVVGTVPRALYVHRAIASCRVSCYPASAGGLGGIILLCNFKSRGLRLSCGKVTTLCAFSAACVSGPGNNCQSGIRVWAAILIRRLK